MFIKRASKDKWNRSKQSNANINNSRAPEKNKSGKKTNKKITCANDVFKLFHRRLRDKKQEHFYIIMLNNQNNITGEQLITKGILNTSIIDSREVFKPAIRNSASRVILVHNHPSGDPNPSSEDREVTEKLIDAGELLGIKVLDHIIISKDKYWSWKENKKV